MKLPRIPPLEVHGTIYPFSLSCALVLGWFAMGYGVVAYLLPREGVRVLLLAPITGLAVFAIAASVLNHIGFAAASFAIPLSMVLVVAGVVLAIARRLRPSPRDLWPIVAVLLAGGVLVDWPSFVLGFDWISFGNDDMTTYLLGGNHFFNHGFFQMPSTDALGSERDPSWDYSFFYSYNEVRFASQLVLACVMKVANLDSGAAFMPTIIAFHLVLLASTGALVCARQGSERVALIAMCLSAVSANVVFGTLQQLMPQDLGIAALAAAATVLFGAPPHERNLRIRNGILGSLFVTLLFIGYTEAVPFFVIGLLLALALNAIRLRVPFAAAAEQFAVTAVGVIVFTNEAFVGSINLLLVQAKMVGPAGRADDDTFPFYLTPQGFSTFWGFSDLVGSTGSETWFQASIVIGALLAVGIALLALRYAWLGHTAAIITVAMLAIVVELFAASSGFGLFKIALYIQPFVLGTIAIALDRRLPVARTASTS